MRYLVPSSSQAMVKRDCCYARLIVRFMPKLQFGVEGSWRRKAKDMGKLAILRTLDVVGTQVGRTCCFKHLAKYGPKLGPKPRSFKQLGSHRDARLKNKRPSSTCCVTILS